MMKSFLCPLISSLFLSRVLRFFGLANCYHLCLHSLLVHSLPFFRCCTLLYVIIVVFFRPVSVEDEQGLCNRSPTVGVINRDPARRRFADEAMRTIALAYKDIDKLEGEEVIANKLRPFTFVI